MISISKRFSMFAERLENLIDNRMRYFILPEARGIKNIFMDGMTLSYELIREDLGKFLFGLRGQAEAWKTSRFQGQAVRKEQLLSGLANLLREWDKISNAWQMYSIEGEGMTLLEKLYHDVSSLQQDAMAASFPN